MVQLQRTKEGQKKNIGDNKICKCAKTICTGKLPRLCSDSLQNIKDSERLQYKTNKRTSNLIAEPFQFKGSKIKPR